MKILLVSLVMLISTSVYAQKKMVLKDLGSLVEKQIRSSSEGLEEAKIDARSDKEWFLKAIMLRVRPSIGLEIEWLAKASVKPEIELYFSR